MQEVVMDDTRRWPVRSTPVSVWSMIAGLVFLSIHAQAGDLGAQESLRWKLYSGEVLKYSNSQKMVVSVKRMGRERKQTRTQTVAYTWNVKEVTQSGEAQIIQRIDHVTMKVEAPPFMPFEFDSKTPATDVPEPFELEVEQLKAVIGAEFSFKMKSNGEIGDLTIPAATVKRLRDALPPELVEKGAFSEQGLKDVLLQSSPPSFPDGPVEPGKTWANKPSKIALPFGTLVSEKILTYQGPDSRNPRLLIVGQQSKVTLQPAAASAADAEIRIRSQEGKGTLTFDAKAGCLIDSRTTQKMEISASEAGQQSDQTSEITLTITLVR